MLKKSIAPISILLVSFIAYWFSFTTVHRIRAELPASYTHAEVFRASPVLMEIVSGDFKGLVADYLILKASYFLGGFYRSVPEDWETVTLLFEQALRLEPHFFTPVYYAQGIVVWRKNVVAKAVELIVSSHQARYWDWEPGFYAGFDYYNLLHDSENAVKYLQESAHRPEALNLVSFLAARYASEADRTETAIAVMTFMLNRTTEELVRSEITRRIKGYQNLLIYEKGIETYRQKFGRTPSSLDALTKDIVLAAPLQPTKEITYFYVPETGEVTIETVPEKLQQSEH